MTAARRLTQTKMLKALLSAATELTVGLSSDTRYRNLIDAVQAVVPCDAASLLRLEGDELVPIATKGLSPEVMGRRFCVAEHTRLRAILRSDAPVRFQDDESADDPFDGLVIGAPSGALEVHSCMGAALRVEGELVGALTVDALQPGMFDKIEDDKFSLFATLAAAALRTAGLIESLEQLAERRGLVAETLVAENMRTHGGEILGKSEAISQLLQEIKTVAPSDLCVLIHGETGTGKELVARSIHAGSSRARQPLVHVNCAALPENIAESELFGHVKGAFTGAVSNRAGKFEIADSGTLFLDEIGELPLSIQPKLLRALQFGEVQRVGQDKAQGVDVRILAATNRDLAEEVRAGRFRPDLYHRLSVFPLRVAALWERREDIAILAGHFLDRAVAKLGTRRARFTPMALQALAGYEWPGNVRELEHVVLRALLRASASAGAEVDPITIDEDVLGMPRPDLPFDPSPLLDSVSVPLGLSLSLAADEFKRTYLLRTLDACSGRWTEVAKRLQMDRGNLYRMRRRLGLM